MTLRLRTGAPPAVVDSDARGHQCVLVQEDLRCRGPGPYSFHDEPGGTRCRKDESSRSHYLLRRGRHGEGPRDPRV